MSFKNKLNQMRIIRFLALVLFIQTGFLLRGTAQSITLVVTTTEGVEQTYQLTHEGQLFFENGDRLIIEDGTGTTASFQLANIRKLVCTEITSVSENNTSELLLTPNPTHDHFLIHHLNNPCEAHIYALDGRLMKTFMATEGMVVDINELAPGMYLLHLDGQTLKMMKL